MQEFTRDENMHTIITPYHSYILRLWHTPPSDPWRATLKDVRDGSQQHFASLDSLIDFLTTQAQPQGE